MKVPRALLAFLAILVLGAGSCAPGRDEQERILAPARVSIPTQILGLTVKQENVDERLSPVTNRTFLDSFGLYSMRQNDLLQASLQVGRFHPLAREENVDFRKQIVGLMGTSNPREIRVGDKKVYNTTGNQQTIFVWFEGRGFFVLTVRNDYPFEFSLLRKLMAIEQGL